MASSHVKVVKDFSNELFRTKSRLFVIVKESAISTSTTAKSVPPAGLQSAS